MAKQQTQGTTFFIGTMDPSANNHAADTLVEIGGVTDFDGPGQSRNVLDDTDLKSTARSKRPGLLDNGQVSLTVQYDPGDAGQTNCGTDFKAGTERNFEIVYGDGSKSQFVGFVSAFTPGSGGVDTIATGSITIEVNKVV